MKNIQTKYPIYILVFSALIFGLSFVANKFMPEAFRYASYYYLISYYFSFTYIILGFLLKSATKSPQKFINTFMIITTIKLLLNGMIAVIFAFTNRAEAKGFLVFFLAYYLLFTAMEVIIISGLKKKE